MRLPRTQLSNAAHTGLPPSTRPRRTRLRAVLGIVAILAVAAIVTSYVSFIASDNEANASAELALLREQVSPLLIYSEFGQFADTIWAADPSNPEDKAYVATVEHSPGFGISASVSPDGVYVAYVALPPDAGWTDAAQLWVLEIASGAESLLAENVDLRTTPVWTPDSAGVVVARPVGSESVQLLLVDLAGGTSVLAQEQAGLYPIGVTPDGAWLYVASLTERGTDLQRVAMSGAGVEVLAHLTDGYSRDWHLAPDGSAVAYLGQTSSAAISFDARVYDTEAGEAPAATWTRAPAVSPLGARPTVRPPPGSQIGLNCEPERPAIDPWTAPLASPPASSSSGS